MTTQPGHRLKPQARPRHCNHGTVRSGTDGSALACELMTFPWNLAVYGLAGLAGGLLALRSGIPAAPLAGALLAAGLASMSGRVPQAQWPVGTRTVLEIGIEPTARHAADLGLLPVVVDDACGVVDADAARRSLDSLDYSLLSYRATTDEVVAAFGS